MQNFARPARFPSSWFSQFVGDVDPVQRVQLAHETAAALLARVRHDADPDVVERLLALAATDGIDEVAELWADAEPHSLPGSLWRLYLIRTMVAQQPEDCARLYTAGAVSLQTVDPVVAGAVQPTGPAEIEALATTILRGVFVGDFALALDRAAACCRVLAAGAVVTANAHDAAEPERASSLTKKAARLSGLAADLAAAASLQRGAELH